MNEFLSALAVLFCSTCYFLGGQENPWTKKGFGKWIRRYVLPAGLCIFLIALDAPWWKACLSCVGLSGALHIGYQNKIWKFAASGLLMGLPAIILCRPNSNWMVFLPMIFHTIFGAISLKWNRFMWGAFVGTLMGTGISIAYLSSLNVALGQ